MNDKDIFNSIILGAPKKEVHAKINKHKNLTAREYFSFGPHKVVNNPQIKDYPIEYQQSLFYHVLEFQNGAFRALSHQLIENKKIQLEANSKTLILISELTNENLLLDMNITDIVKKFHTIDFIRKSTYTFFDNKTPISNTPVSIYKITIENMVVTNKSTLPGPHKTQARVKTK